MADLAQIPKDDDALYRALRDAHIPSLMAALVHVTGDPQLIRGEIRPKNDFLADAQGGLTPAQQEQIRALAFHELRKFRDGGQRLPPAPSQDVVGEMWTSSSASPLRAGLRGVPDLGARARGRGPVRGARPLDAIPAAAKRAASTW